MQMFIGFLFASSAVLAGLWVNAYRKYKAAKLIKENIIMEVCSSIYSGFSHKPLKSDDIKNEKIQISYFGILIADNIIRFNQNGIQLKAVEIGPDYLSFTYGKEKNIKNIKLFRPQISKEELNKFVERIHYETGIIVKYIN